MITSKRAFDIAVAVTGLVVTSPLTLGIAATNLAVFGKNPFFPADRVGKDGEPFSMFKFRTMDDTKDEKGDLLKDDKRLSRYGRFLRASGLDELPQLLNIVKGDMSVVGPRPRNDEVDGPLPEGYRKILSVRPGLVGPWQVAAIGCVPTQQERLDMDLTYAGLVERQNTLMTDIGLMVQVLPSFVKGHNGESFSAPEAKEESTSAMVIGRE